MRRQIGRQAYVGGRAPLALQAGIFSLSIACACGTAGEQPPRRSEPANPPRVLPPAHHDVSPPLRELPPAPAPPEDLKREVPIHRVPLPERK
jgi:hypothetical protein